VIDRKRNLFASGVVSLGWKHPKTGSDGGLFAEVRRAEMRQDEPPVR
jgi:hypothetical protein